MNKLNLFYLVLIVILVLAIGGSVSVYNYYTAHVTIGLDNTAASPKWSVSQWGTFGDFFGGILGPILSFFSLLAILLALALQMQQLSTSTAEMKESAVSLKRQSFDNSFFALVGFHNDIVKDMDLRDIIDADVTAQGRDVFHVLFKRIWKIYEGKLRTISNEEERVIAAYEEFLKNNEYQVGHYFRNLYRIYKFIDESDAVTSVKEKRNYSGIIRAQLSTYELALLFFNSLHKNGRPFKEYIEKYAVFENFRYKHMKEDFTLSEDLYDKRAWGTPK